MIGGITPAEQGVPTHELWFNGVFMTGVVGGGIEIESVVGFKDFTISSGVSPGVCGVELTL